MHVTAGLPHQGHLYTGQYQLLDGMRMQVCNKSTRTHAHNRIHLAAIFFSRNARFQVNCQDPCIHLNKQHLKKKKPTCARLDFVQSLVACKDTFFSSHQITCTSCWTCDSEMGTVSEKLKHLCVCIRRHTHTHIQAHTQRQNVIVQSITTAA